MFGRCTNWFKMHLWRCFMFSLIFVHSGPFRATWRTYSWRQYSCQIYWRTPRQHEPGLAGDLTSMGIKKKLFRAWMKRFLAPQNFRQSHIKPPYRINSGIYAISDEYVDLNNLLCKLLFLLFGVAWDLPDLKRLCHLCNGLSLWLNTVSPPPTICFFFYMFLPIFWIWTVASSFG